MGKENISQEIKLKNKKGMKNYFFKEIDRSELVSKKHKKASTILNHIEKFHILAPVVNGCASVCIFTSCFGIPAGIRNSVIGLNIFAITA